MNKKEIREQLETKKRDKLLAIDEAYNKQAKVRATLVLNEVVGDEIDRFEEALSKLMRTPELEFVVRASSALKQAIYNTKEISIRNNDLSDLNRMLHNVKDGTFNHNAQYTVGSWSSNPRAEDRKTYEDYKDLRNRVESEFKKLNAYLTSVSTNKFVAVMAESDMHFKESEPLKNLPAPKFSMDLLG